MLPTQQLKAARISGRAMLWARARSEVWMGSCSLWECSDCNTLAVRRGKRRPGRAAARDATQRNGGTRAVMRNAANAAPRPGGRYKIYLVYYYYGRYVAGQRHSGGRYYLFPVVL